jgi:hypothetical protein
LLEIGRAIASGGQLAEVDGGDEEHAAAGQAAGNTEDHDGDVKRNDESERFDCPY